VQGSRLDGIHIFLVRFFIEMGLIVTGFSLLPLLLSVWGMPAGPVRKTKRAEALQELTIFFGQQPEGSYSTAGRSVGRSKSWVVGALDELETRGLVHRDGKVIHVLEGE